MTKLEDARYGKHSVYGSLVRAKAEGNLDALKSQIVDVKKHLR